MKSTERLHELPVTDSLPTRGSSITRSRRAQHTTPQSAKKAQVVEMTGEGRAQPPEQPREGEKPGGVQRSKPTRRIPFQAATDHFDSPSLVD